MPPKNKTFYIALLLLFLGLLPAYSSAAENDHENLFGVSDNKIEAYHAYLSAVYGSHSEETGDNIDKRKNKRRRDKNDFRSVKSGIYHRLFPKRTRLDNAGTIIPRK